MKVSKLKGLIKMAEEKQMGVISEEALDEIAGGLSINKKKLVSVLKGVGVGIGVLGGVAGAAGLGALAYKASKKNGGAVSAKAYPKVNRQAGQEFLSGITEEFSPGSALSHDERVARRTQRAFATEDEDREAEEVADMLFGKE